MRTLLIITTLLFSASLQAAQWQLGSPSEVIFLSTKNTHLTEVHRFARLQGSLHENGTAKLVIDLSSIDSAIPIRDERMREILFKTATFTQATLLTKIDQKVLAQAKQGVVQQYELTGRLNLHGNEADVTVLVVIVPAKNGDLVVSSIKPVMIYADQFELTQGIQALRDIAKLERIAEVVPVSFTLTFKAK